MCGRTIRTIRTRTNAPSSYWGRHQIDFYSPLHDETLGLNFSYNASLNSLNTLFGTGFGSASVNSAQSEKTCLIYANYSIADWKKTSEEAFVNKTCAVSTCRRFEGQRRLC